MNKQTYTALIIDDEPVLRHHLKRLLDNSWPDLDVLDMAGDGQTALALIKAHQPDVVFLDIQMPGVNGMQVAANCKTLEKAPHIIFITAYDEYAVDAFEHNAIDYLLKPVNEQRLTRSIERLQQRLQSKSDKPAIDIEALSALLTQAPISKAAAEPLRWLKASHGDNIHLIDVNDVIYFQAEDKYTTVVTQDRNYLIRTPIKELTLQLDGDKFWQIHRGVIVCVTCIEKVQRDLTGRMQVFLKDHKQRLPVSRNFVSLFKQM